MNNFTAEQALILNDLQEEGNLVYSLTYNPNIIVGDPEGDMISSGLFEFYREVSENGNLIEIIYTTPAPNGSYVLIPSQE